MAAPPIMQIVVGYRDGARVRKGALRRAEFSASGMRFSTKVKAAVDFTLAKMCIGPTDR
ncbi:MAG: hypothetical protein AAGF56_14785 [Pseudomonadota bacterium]